MPKNPGPTTRSAPTNMPQRKASPIAPPVTGSTSSPATGNCKSCASADVGITSSMRLSPVRQRVEGVTELCSPEDMFPTRREIPPLDELLEDIDALKEKMGELGRRLTALEKLREAEAKHDRAAQRLLEDVGRKIERNFRPNLPPQGF